MDNLEAGDRQEIFEIRENRCELEREIATA
jgi:hypothetical protein